MTLIRSYWLAVIEVTRPELCPLLFEVDLAPFILRFIKVLFRNRNDGGCRGELMRGFDDIHCSVFLVDIGSTFVVGRRIQAAGCRVCCFRRVGTVQQ